MAVKPKPKRPVKPKAGQRPMRITNKRLASIRMEDPKALPGIKPAKRYSPRDRRAIAQENLRRSRARAKAKKQNAAAPAFDPLAPVTPANAEKELDARTTLQFADKERALRQEQANNRQDVANVGGYYDDYKRALAEAQGRIAGANQNAVDEMQRRADALADRQGQESAGRDAALAGQAQAFGRPAPTSVEGQQAASATRAQGTFDASQARERGRQDVAFTEKAGANALLKKAEALAQENARGRKIREAQTEVASDKGTFRVAERGRLRDDEREWAAIQQEFGLKEADQKAKAKTSAQDRKLEQQKLATQALVARIYADSNKAKAAATVRVAKLQLQKGKIDQKQYREIVNIYKGLPKKGQPGGASSGGGGSKSGGSKSGGGGSGAGGSYAPWERDKIDRAFRSIDARSPEINRRRSIIDQLVKAGIPARLARVAWARYEKKFKSVPTPRRRSAPGANGQKRPQ